MARTDNDTWDLATGVGTTATGVAASRALATRSADPLITDAYAEPLVRAVGLDYYIRLAEGRLDDISDDVETLNPDLLAQAMAIRTRYFDDFFLAATQAGIRQAVILASGLDARPYRLDWPAGTTVFELDQPAVIEFKVQTLADLGANPTAAVEAIGIDLRQDWPAELRARGFDTSAPTAWIAEGLLGYLPPEAQDRLFDDITALSAPGSRIATDWNDNSESLASERVRAMTARQREQGLQVDDVTDMLFDGQRHPVPGYLTDRGWRTDTTNAENMFTVHGRTFLRDEAISGLLDANYTSAELVA